MFGDGVVEQVLIGRKDQSYLVGEKLCLFQVSAGKSLEDVIALDLPFILTLPTNRPMPGSISLGKSTVETCYQLFVSLIYGKQQLSHHIAFPVRIKRYDTLSTFGAFRVPTVKSVTSADHLVTVDYSTPISSFGPGDNVMAYIKVSPNPDWTKAKKVKLQRITMQIIELITFNHEGDEPVERRRRLCKTAKQLDLKLPENGYLCELTLDFPSLDLRDKDGVISKERQEIPLISRNGFSTTASLYKIEYLLVIKARFAHSKDIEIEQLITVTPFDHATCMSFMKNISDSVEYANRTDRNAIPGPRVYKPNDTSLPFGRLSHGVPGIRGACTFMVT